MTEPVSLVIAEHAGHVEAAQAAGLLSGPGMQLLTVTASAHYSATRLAIPAVCPETFYSEREMVEAGEWVTNMLSELERQLDPLLLERTPVLRRLRGPGPVALAWWELHKVISPYAAAVCMVNRVLDGLQPKRIVCFAGQAPQPHFLGVTIGSPWLPIVKEVGRQRGVEVEVMPEPAGCDSVRDTMASPISSRIVGAMRRVHTLIDWWPFRRLRTSGNRRPFLILSLGYDMNGFVKEAIRRARCRLYLWRPNEAPYRLFPFPFRRLRTVRSGPANASLESTWTAYEAMPWFGTVTTYEGVALGRILAEEFRHFCNHLVSEMARILEEAESVLDRLEPAAVLTVIAYWREHIVQRLAVLRNIPAVEYNHGVGIMATAPQTIRTPLAYQRGWRWASHVLVQGDRVRDYMEQWYRAGDRTVPVGSVYLDELRRRIGQHRDSCRAKRLAGVSEKTPVVLYIQSHAEGAVRYPPHRARPSNRQWQLEERILAAASLCPGITLLVKAYPDSGESGGWTPLENAINDRGYANCRVIRSSALADVLAAADLYIADNPSLSFFEALITDKPVVLCGWESALPFDPGANHPSNHRAWCNRITYLHTLEDIDKTLPELFAKLPLPPVTDDALLRGFATHRNDGQSAERAWQALEAIVAQGVRAVSCN
jgi:hypothetical protein